MSSIIPGWRARISETAPVRNGWPPQTYMTVPSIGETHHTHPASGKLVAQQVGEHLVEGHHRYSQDQHDPEQSPELSDVVAVPSVTVPCVSAVPRMVAVTAGVVVGIVVVVLALVVMVVGVLVMVVTVLVWRD